MREAKYLERLVCELEGHASLLKYIRRMALKIRFRRASSINQKVYTAVMIQAKSKAHETLTITQPPS